MAEEAVFDVVRGAHVCGAADGVGEMLGASDAGILVGVPLDFIVDCHGAVYSCTSRRELWRKSKVGSPLRHTAIVLGRYLNHSPNEHLSCCPQD